MQVIWALALQHPLAAVTHEVKLMYVGQIQGPSLSCLTVGPKILKYLDVLCPISLCYADASPLRVPFLIDFSYAISKMFLRP